MCGGPEHPCGIGCRSAWTPRGKGKVTVSEEEENQRLNKTDDGELIVSVLSVALGIGWHKTGFCGHYASLIGARWHSGSCAERPPRQDSEYWPKKLTV